MKCSLCSEEKASGALDVWVSDCCDSAFCYACVTSGLGEASMKGQYQCLSISCLEPLSDYVPRLALMWRAQQQRLEAPAQPIALTASVASQPARVLTVAADESWSLLELAGRVFEALAFVAGPSVDLYLRFAGGKNGQLYRLDRAKQFQSLRCLEVKSGDTVVVDLDGSLPSVDCFSCKTTVARKEMVSSAVCGHLTCGTCARTFALKVGGSPPPCPVPCCLAAGPVAPFSTTRVRLFVWEERACGSVDVGPATTTRHFLTQGQSAAGVGAGHGAFVLDDPRQGGLIQVPDPPGQLLAESIVPARPTLVFIPDAIAHKIGHFSNQ